MEDIRAMQRADESCREILTLLAVAVQQGLSQIDPTSFPAPLEQLTEHLEKSPTKRVLQDAVTRYTLESGVIHCLPSGRVKKDEAIVNTVIYIPATAETMGLTSWNPHHRVSHQRTLSLARHLN